MGKLEAETQETTTPDTGGKEQKRVRTPNPNPSVVVSMMYELMRHMRTNRIPGTAIKNIINAYTDTMAGADIDWDAAPGEDAETEPTEE